MEMPNIKLFSQVRPTVLIPVWKLAGFTLGAGCSLLGEKGAMACTVAVGGDILFKFCISENPGCKRERFYVIVQVEALVTKHYDDQVTEMVENNPRLDENLIEVIKKRFFP